MREDPHTSTLLSVLWAAPSIESPGKETIVVETNPERGLCRAFEGEPGDYAALSVETDAGRVLEKAKLVLRGDPEALGDARVTTALATILVSLFERGVEPPRLVSIAPRKKEPQL